jgi:hypothetical protein
VIFVTIPETEIMPSNFSEIAAVDKGPPYNGNEAGPFGNWADVETPPNKGTIMVGKFVTGIVPVIVVAFRFVNPFPSPPIFAENIVVPLLVFVAVIKPP